MSSKTIASRSRSAETNLDAPFTSVIVPTFNRPRQLRKCLAALARQKYPSDRFEVIVVDDGGEQALAPVIRGAAKPPNTVLVRQGNAGPAAARNFGSRTARGVLLAFTDDDCAPDQKWLLSLAKAHRCAPSAMLGGQIRTGLRGDIFASVNQLILEGAYAFYNRNPDKAVFFASNNIALPAAGFRAVGGFPEHFKVASEDRELCDLWGWNGYTLRFIPSAVVYHQRELDFHRFAQLHFRYGRGAFQYHRERARRRTISVLRELGTQGRFLRTFIPLVRRQPLNTMAKTCGLLAVWQFSNAAGFLYAAAASLFRSNTTLHEGSRTD